MTIFHEYKTVENFVQFCHDDERDYFTTADMQALNRATHIRLQDIRKELEDYGLKFVPRKPQKRVRGFTSNPHTLYQDIGCRGTSGWEQIAGFAGEKWKEGH